MHWIRFFTILLIVTVLNTGNLLNTIAIGSLNIRPDLLLILLIFFAANSPVLDAVIASFAIGFAADISGAAMGPHIVCFGLIGSAISQMRKVVIMKRMIHQAGAIFFAALFAGVLIQILTYIKTDIAASNIYRVISATALYSAIVGPVVWGIFGQNAKIMWFCFDSCRHLSQE